MPEPKAESDDRPAAPLSVPSEPAAEQALSKGEKKKLREAWVKRFQGAVRVLHIGMADEVREVEDWILATRDPAALGPMLSVLGRESAPIRLLLDRTLVRIDDELAWVALAERLLVEPEADVRRGLIKLVAAKPDDPGLDRFFRHIHNAITSANPVRAGLGALAAADLDWHARVPNLIDKLAPVRFVRNVEWVPAPVSAGAGLAAGSVEGYVVVPVPVVGPGVVAYGQQIYPIGSGLAMGGGASAPALQPVVRAGRVPHPNPAVLAALVRLTGEDFGYDTIRWRAWMAESFRANPMPPKRVPTP